MDPDAVAAFQFVGQDIPWMVRRWAETRPDHPFLVWEPRSGDDRTWTYAQFVSDMDSVAAGLAARGVGVGDKVLIHADNCPEAVIAWYACARLGAVGVTTNTRSVAAEVAYFASHSQAVGVITQPQYAALIDEATSGMRFTFVTADNFSNINHYWGRNHRTRNLPFRIPYQSLSSIPLPHLAPLITNDAHQPLSYQPESPSYQPRWPPATTTAVL